ncbi:MAG: RIP metalloprotease RseP [Bdellovibrionia bacterium]
MEILLSSVSTLFSAIVPFVTLLGILIFVHELGHFLVARWCGVRVEVFSLGFGKKLLSYKRGDTTYALSLIPLGGYVKMFGEQNGDTVSEDERGVSFTHKTVWQRIAIVLAGPMMNFLFAIVIFFAIGLIGEDHRLPVLGDFKESSPAYQAGFRPGDFIKSINGQSVRSMEEVQKFLSLNTLQDVTLSFEVERQFSKEVAKVDATFIGAQNPNVLSKFDFVARLEGFDAYTQGTTVGVKPNTIFASLGINTGSQILAVNNVEVKSWRELLFNLQAAKASEQLHLRIKNPGSEDIAELNLSSGAVDALTPEKLGFESSDLYLAAIVKGSPAEKAGLLKNDRITAINGKPILVWEDVLNEIRNSEGKTSEFTITRGTETLVKTITPEMTTHMTIHGREEKRYTIGIAPMVNIAFPDTINIKADGLGHALVRGVERTWDVSVMTVMSFVRLFQGMISPKNIGGVISIGQAAHETYKMGLIQFLQMMAIISVNLFILNLLPIPVLDGGHLVFYSIEVLKGAPLSMRKMEIAQQVGLALLMSLMVFALFNDFTRLLGL